MIFKTDICAILILLLTFHNTHSRADQAPQISDIGWHNQRIIFFG